jgi:hypothetical protein
MPVTLDPFLSSKDLERSQLMAIVVKFEVSGMDASKYDRIMEELTRIGQEAPDGRRYHVCFGDRRTLQVIDVFESPAQLEAFGAKLMPILEKFGVQARPDVLGEIHNAVLGR